MTTTVTMPCTDRVTDSIELSPPSFPESLLSDDDLVKLYQYSAFAKDNLAVLAELVYHERQNRKLLSHTENQFLFQLRIWMRCQKQVIESDSILTLTLLEVLQEEGLLTNTGAIRFDAVVKRSRCLLHGEAWYPQPI